MELTIDKDKRDLESLENIIQQNINGFYNVGQALVKIRDQELYKLKNGGKYETFEQYCRGVWDFTRSRAYQLIEYTQVKDNLSTTVDIPERQLRPLAKLKPEQQPQAWARAKEMAPDGKVTATIVSRAVKEITSPEIREKPKKETQMIAESTARDLSDTAISQLEKIRPDDPQRINELERVKNWINKNMGLMNELF